MSINKVSSPLLVACICAEWCKTCNTYREIFFNAQSQFEGAVSFHWLDIEDDDELLQSVEVDNFPTILIANSTAVSFYGVLQPHEATLIRIIQNSVENPTLAIASSEIVADLSARLLELAKH